MQSEIEKIGESRERVRKSSSDSIKVVVARGFVDVLQAHSEADGVVVVDDFA